MGWFEVDKEGLRQVHERLVARRGFGMLVGELYQNVADCEEATECLIGVTKVEGKPRAILEVTDNGPGFSRLTDAWTMFASSLKKDDPTKAGRFNTGEKIVLSFCHTAKIETTSGTVIFDEDGRHEHPRQKRDCGTRVEMEIRCTAEQYDELLTYLPTIMVREGLRLCVNGAEIAHREPLHTWDETLTTEIGDELRKTRRKAEVHVYEPHEGETAMLYELGIPVVATDDKYHVSIQQKVPLNSDRDNVTPAFLKEVRVSVLNHMHEQLDPEDTHATWVNEAASDKRCEDEAVETFRVQKYGARSVAFDPNNPEANAQAVADGQTLIPSRGLTPGQRNNLKESGTLMSSSRAYPTSGQGVFGSDGLFADESEELGDEELTEAMKAVREYSADMGVGLLGTMISVRFVKAPYTTGVKPWVAAYGGCKLIFNIQQLGKKWFDDAVGSEKLDELLIHEFGHHYSSNHLSSEYYDALCKLGARLKVYALNNAKHFTKEEPANVAEN